MLLCPIRFWIVPVPASLSALLLQSDGRGPECNSGICALLQGWFSPFCIGTVLGLQVNP